MLKLLEKQRIKQNINKSFSKNKIVLEKKLDIDSYLALEKALNNKITKNNTQLVLDCSKVRALDSSSLGVIACALSRVHKLGGCLEILGARKQILKVLEISGLVEDKALTLA